MELSTAKPASSRDLALTGRLDQFAQSALGSSGCVSVHQILAGGLIDPFRRQAEFGLRLFDVSRGNRFAYAANLRSNTTLQRSIMETTFGVLTKSLFGAFSVGHFGIGRRGGVMVKMTGMFRAKQYRNLATDCPESTCSAKMLP